MYVVASRQHERTHLTVYWCLIVGELQADSERTTRLVEPGSFSRRQHASRAGHRLLSATSSHAFLGNHARLRHARSDRRSDDSPDVSQRVGQGR